MTRDILRSARYALCVSVAFASLPACAAPQSRFAVPVIPQNLSTDHTARSGSWMLPEAKGDDLLYVTNYSTVLVFSYPDGKLVGTLKGFYSAVGECVDAKSDVFITNYKPVAVYEYAHGGTKRIATFPTKKAGTVGCAIDPISGDLAISGQTDAVEIFRNASGKPVVVRDPHMFFGQFCAYDDKGNLFFDGLQDPKGKPRLSELPGGTGNFVGIALDAPIDGEAGIQWDGTNITAVSYVPPRGRTRKPAIVRFAISGARGSKVGSTVLNKPADIVLQYLIINKSLIAPNIYFKSGQHSDVLFYRYPAGGVPTMALVKLITDARGVVVSLATKAR